ncbi:hypothetical protein [Dokdonella sp.]|uniref:hypothetical protein n=1 Tax=Dokdonella sp. TaxID=2291710 RepID=UPI0026212757|nr:hypothetical protein [Dokdonella sp.]
MKAKCLAGVLVAALSALPCGAVLASGYDDAIMTSEAYRFTHADLRWRSAGEQAYAARDMRNAWQKFERAARYADKPSQAMIASMLWNGDGVPQDRALAYAWIDLAAERGYPRFLATREQYWNALSEPERARAIEVGQGVYDEFGDKVAKPRLEQELITERRKNTTGSRLGNAGPAQIKVFDQATGKVLNIPGMIYGDPKYWDPAAHWSAVDAMWKGPEAAAR